MANESSDTEKKSSNNTKRLELISEWRANPSSLVQHLTASRALGATPMSAALQLAWELKLLVVDEKSNS